VSSRKDRAIKRNLVLKKTKKQKTKQKLKPKKKKKERKRERKKILQCGSWRAGSVVKSIGCSSRRPRFNF
jgi:hypothetical protein